MLAREKTKLPEAANLPAVSRELHPAVLDHATRWSEALDTIDRISAENRALQNEVEVLERRCEQLQVDLEKTTDRRDFFQRYAIEIGTHLDHIVMAARRAHDRAIEAGVARPDDAVDQSGKVLEAEIANIVREQETEGRK